MGDEDIDDGIRINRDKRKNQRRREPDENMKKFYEKTYPVKNVVFNESFKRKINDPNYNADH